MKSSIANTKRFSGTFAPMGLRCVAFLWAIVVTFSGCNLFVPPTNMDEVAMDATHGDTQLDADSEDTTPDQMRDATPDTTADATPDLDVLILDAHVADAAIDTTVDADADVGPPRDYCVDYLALNPVGYWPLNTASANDSYENIIAQDGFPPLIPQTNVPQTQGHHLNALRFDGAQTAATIPNAPIFEVPAGSVAMWVMRDAGFNCTDTTTGCGLFSKDAQGFEDGGHMTIAAAPGNLIRVRSQSQTASYQVVSVSSLRANMWEHVLVSFGPDGLRLYVNGTLEATNPYTGGFVHVAGGGLDAATNLESVGVGFSRWSADAGTQDPKVAFFAGAVDEILFFDRQLSADDVSQVAGSCP